ncbi:unnamed protein product [Schistocephalus solidus]|uniref:Uncharacterized protein n=2 Tax=Schistocephalus solidus TaxID=70667 RepID=A0A3P7BWC5_SCHSO|nr:unnamed protein product [Schistocephalus solidus]
MDLGDPAAPATCVLSVGSEPGVVVRPGAAPAAPATCVLSHARCGGTPRGGSDRASHMRPLPFTCLGAARTWGTQPRQPPASSPASGVVARPGAAPAAPATCALSHLRQVWWYAQGRFRPRQPPAPSPISGLDSVLTPGSGGGGGESAVDAA